MIEINQREVYHDLYNIYQYYNRTGDRQKNFYKTLWRIKMLTLGIMAAVVLVEILILWIGIKYGFITPKKRKINKNLGGYNRFEVK